jgi:chaperone required for assembly of F1-ATPase
VPESLLQLEVVPALTLRGILAATLSSGDLKWQGIVLVPELDTQTKDDQWGEHQRRMATIENGEGVYRRMDLK